MRGLPAILEFTRKFDNVRVSKGSLRVRQAETDAAYSAIPKAQLSAMRSALRRIRKFHNLQRKSLLNVRMKSAEGTTELRWLPLGRAGIYAPAGLAPLPSSVLMAAIPAKLAGVRDIVLCTPPQKDGKASPAVLVAAAECGIRDIYKIGGAQAIAAMAFGLPGMLAPADIIAGPGNRFVTAAKSIVMQRGIAAVDTVAGPSEVLIIADSSANPAFVAADMLAQLEHGGDSLAVLLTTERKLVSEVEQELASQISKLPNGVQLEQNARKNGLAVVVRTLAEAAQLADSYAAEHVEVYCRGAGRVANALRNAGAIFVRTGEVYGDYGFSGSNHILPTGGAARFRGGVSVYTFMKYVLVERMSPLAQKRLAKKTAEFADLEGLPAHASSARFRMRGR